MTTPNYDDILNALDRQAKVLKDEARVLLKAKDCDATYLFEDARLLREAMEIVRKRRFAGNRGVEPPQAKPDPEGVY